MAFASSNSTLGSTYHDTAHPYPDNRGTAANPLTDLDIQNEVSVAILANGWQSGGYGAAYFVFTAKGIESCADSFNCTPGTAHPTFCAYHGSFGTSATPILYANMPYVATWDSGFSGGSCTSFVFSSSPNNHDADEEISTASHEHLEIITDPVNYSDVNGFHGGWYDSGGWEIGDKCAYFYGTQSPDGSNVTLNGNLYLVQREWSNIDANGSAYSGCSIDYSVDTNVVATGPTSVAPSNNLTYTLTIANNGPKLATGVVLSDSVPVHTKFISLTQTTGPTSACVSPAQGTTGTITCTLDPLALGSSVRWTLIVKVDSNASVGSVITNVANLWGSAADSNPANNSSSTTSNVTGTPTAVTLSSFVATAENKSLQGTIVIALLLLAIPIGSLAYGWRRRAV
jgi:uncharacterized repeat protein (TIGR01451 family)